MLSGKYAILANNGELTWKSYYAMSSNIHHPSDTLVLTDPCIKKIKKRQTCGSVHSLCEYIQCVLSSVSFRLQLNYACCHP